MFFLHTCTKSPKKGSLVESLFCWMASLFDGDIEAEEGSDGGGLM